MTLDDLKNNWVIEFEGGGKALVLKDSGFSNHTGKLVCLYLQTAGGKLQHTGAWDILAEVVRPDLSANSSSWNKRIIKVYQPSSPKTLLNWDKFKEYHKLVWEYNPAPKTVTFGDKEYTKEEFEKLQDSINNIAKQFEE